MKNTFWILITLLVCIGCKGPSKPQLHLYSWADYVKPDIIDRFEKQFDCRVIIDTFDGNEAMYAKLKTGASGYDIIIPSGYYLNLMEKQKLVQPLDFSLIPNYKNIDLKHPALANIKECNDCVPYLFSYTLIAYRKDKVTSIEPTWNMFAKKSLHRRMTMLNDIRDTIGAGLKYLGYSANSRSQQEIDAATKQVILWKKNLAKFESEQYKNGIASGEYLLVQGYNGDIIQVMQENDNISFVLPKEGLTISCDYLVIPKNAKEPKLAHAFINFMLDPDIAAENMSFVCHLSPVTAAYSKLSAELLQNQALFPPKEILEKSEAILDVGNDILMYNHAWDLIKEASE